jgi:hypothetical protein
MIRKFVADQGADRPLRRTVSFGHRVEAAGELVGDRSRNAESRQGLGRGHGSDSPHEFGIDLQYRLLGRTGAAILLRKCHSHIGKVHFRPFVRMNFRHDS